MFAVVIVALGAAAVAAGQEAKNISAPSPTPPSLPARQVPFYSRDYTILDTEGTAANTGIVEDTRHVVGPANKWMTLSSGGSGGAHSTKGIGIEVLQEFSFGRLPPMGYAGTPLPSGPPEYQPVPAAAAANGRNGERAPGKPATRPVAEPRGVLARKGTTKILEFVPATEPKSR